MMLGWQAAQDLGKRVGDTVTIDRTPYRVVGIYSIRQVFGDAASMFPLIPLQAAERKPGTVTLVAVKVRPGASIDRVRQRVEAQNPNLATVRLASEFGRVDRNFAFLKAAQTGATIIALVIGIIIVMNTMLLSFIERIREFGLLRSVGWTRRRLLSLVIGEALGISLLGAAAGVALSFALVFGLSNFSSLRGILQPDFSAQVFWTALYSAIGIGLIAALYPSARAAMLRPGVALRRE
jgi:putative ABC transport system permease protein